MTLQLEGFVPLIQVFDMPRAVAFYRDVLGFELVSQSEPGDLFDWGLLERGSMRLMLNTAYERDARPEAPDSARVAAHGDTSLFFACPDPDAAYLYLRIKREQPGRAEEVLRLMRWNGGNSSGTGVGCIDYLGNVHPDQFSWHLTLGNVRERRFSEIWRRHYWVGIDRSPGRSDPAALRRTHRHRRVRS